MAGGDSTVALRWLTEARRADPPMICLYRLLLVVVTTLDLICHGSIKSLL
jgi:hypothetical protein